MATFLTPSDGTFSVGDVSQRSAPQRTAPQRTAAQRTASHRNAPEHTSWLLRARADEQGRAQETCRAIVNCA
jgi:hypothetical protein